MDIASSAASINTYALTLQKQKGSLSTPPEQRWTVRIPIATAMRQQQCGRYQHHFLRKFNCRVLLHREMAGRHGDGR